VGECKLDVPLAQLDGLATVVVVEAMGLVVRGAWDRQVIEVPKGIELDVGDLVPARYCRRV
jgi:hypothetical protein